MRLAAGLACLISLLGIGVPSGAYDLEAHSAITSKASGEPGGTVDRVLKALGYSDGINTELRSDSESRTAQDWLQEGSKREDKPDIRVRNHFHNPLASTWDDAGLRFGFIPLGQSSVLWQQNPNQGSVSWAWPNARKHYFEALTLPKASDRDAAFARLFRSVGQTMHLLQDASLPAHTRNDAHLYKALLGVDLGNPDGYERWVDKLEADELKILLSRTVIRPSNEIFRRPSGVPLSSRTDHPQAPAPVKRLIDTGQYVGTNPDILVGGQVGMAEFSNGNFFSNDTIFADKPALFGTIPFPAKTSVELGPPNPRRAQADTRGDTSSRFAMG